MDRDMSTLEQEFDDFAAFVKGNLASSTGATMDDLYDRWRETRPAREDELAIKASLDDMAAGVTGRPFEEFEADFCERNGIAEH